jgi:hypothetical protein
MFLKTLGLLAYIAVLLAIGIACLWRPDKVQALAIKTAERGMTPRCSALNRFVRSRQYLVNIRAVGALAILTAVFMLWLTLEP